LIRINDLLRTGVYGQKKTSIVKEMNMNVVWLFLIAAAVWFFLIGWRLPKRGGPG
jgi:hypothetical protein